MKKTILIDGMKCAGCAETVSKNFESVDGVERAVVDLDSKTAVVETDRELTLDELNSTLSDTNFTATDITNI